MSRPTDAREDAAVAALISEWNLHEPDARRMVRIVLRSADAHTFPEKLTTSPEHVQIPAESEHEASCDRCPTCEAHMPVGQTCGGVNCGLRGKMLPNDVCRCVPSRDCPLKESCRRFLEPGRVMADWSLRFLGETECGARIPVEPAK